MSAAMATDWRDQVCYREPMARHTSWRVGGLADVYFKPQSVAQLQQYLAHTGHNESLFWVGLGSNLLVRDGGIRGTVVATQFGLKGLESLGGGRYRVEAGVTCARMARQAQKDGFGAAAFLGGIPGTMGGALAMNAGAFGSETWDFVESLEVLDSQGQIKSQTPEAFTVGYRSVDLAANHWFVAATFDFSNAPGETHNIQALLQKRNDSQPIGEPSCGSVFRNPPGDHAARLIEAAGLKGHLIGGAQVSLKHANFIINTGTATAADIEQLIATVQQQVEQQFSVALQTEVRVIGEPHE